METNQTFTDVQVLDMTIRTLSNINVPIGLIQQIADPISICIGNLNSLKEAIERKNAEKMKPIEQMTMQTEDGEDIVMELVSGPEEEQDKPAE